VTEFKVPELGENVTGGDVLRILVNVGDTITKDQAVVELETDKATIEVPSSIAGVVKDIKVKQGDKVKVGSVILTLDDAGSGNGAEAAAAAPKAADAAQPESTPKSQIPKPNDSAEPKAQSPTPKADQAGQKADQKVVAMPRAARQEPAAAPAKPAEPARAAAPPRGERGPAAPASPGVRRLAREIGVDINEIQGSGEQGRISEEDVKEHARRILSSVGTSRAATGAPGVPLPDFERWGEIERQPMSNVRRTTSQRLSHAWNAIPHVTQCDKADITAMEELRKKYREQVRQSGGDLTVTAMLVKVLATAVKQFPQFNSSLDLENESIIYKKYVNVGVAVDTDRGLLVPVIRHADQKNITQIAIEVHDLAQRARDRKLTLEAMSGGSITISNLGGIGGTYFTPIVNWPEVAILGVSRGIIEPVWVPGSSSGGPLGPPKNAPAGAFEARQLLPVSLSYDHRVIDGADAMRFLRWVVEAVEQPFLLSLHG
jgi:pyruvate dehydrogenase E2 component (dihydrolipoamide acetyltransferase)